VGTNSVDIPKGVADQSCSESENSMESKIPTKSEGENSTEDVGVDMMLGWSDWMFIAILPTKSVRL
jgi:hypothetical protein